MGEMLRGSFNTVLNFNTISLREKKNDIKRSLARHRFSGHWKLTVLNHLRGLY